MALLGPPRAFIGLDIGVNTIRLAELIDRGRALELAAHARVARTSKDSPRAVAGQIAHMLDQAAASADIVGMAVPARHLFSTTITLPNLPTDQMEQAIAFRAGEIVPSDLADVTLSWVEHPEQAGNIVSVYITATPKRVSDWYQQIAQHLNLELATLEPEINSLVRAHSAAQRGTALFCHVDDNEMSVHLTANGRPIASHTLETADTDWKEKIHRFIGSPHPSRTIVTGDSPQLAQVAANLQTALGYRPHISNPWQGLAYPQGVEDQLTELGPSLAVAVGLAQSRLPHKIE